MVMRQRSSTRMIFWHRSRGTLIFHYAIEARIFSSTELHIQPSTESISTLDVSPATSVTTRPASTPTMLSVRRRAKILSAHIAEVLLGVLTMTSTLLSIFVRTRRNASKSCLMIYLAVSYEHVLPLLLCLLGPLRPLFCWAVA